MTLLIDIGNTRLKIGYATAKGTRLVSQTLALAHSEWQQLLPWLKAQGLAPKHALGISVSSLALTSQVTQLLESIGCQARWLDATTSCDFLLNGYEYPERLGADRWLALIGILATQAHQPARPIVHASFGTATTVDTVLPRKIATFVGGVILPGPQLMYDALALNTEQLRSDLGVLQAFPTNTQSAISSGINAAQTGAVLQQWLQTLHQRHGTPLLVCSGGGWPLVQEHMQKTYAEQLRLLHLAAEPIHWQATPVLDGLAYLAPEPSFDHH